MERDLLIRITAIERKYAQVDVTLYNSLLMRLNDVKQVKLLPTAEQATKDDLIRLYGLVLNQRESQLAMQEFKRTCMERDSEELTIQRKKHDEYVASVLPLLKDGKRSHNQILDLTTKLASANAERDKLRIEIAQEREKRQCLRPTYRILNASLENITFEDEQERSQIKEALSSLQTLLKN